MKNLKFWKPIIISLIATPPSLFLGIISGGAGHGTYFLAKMLFPFTMLSTMFSETITTPFIILAILQIPFYGMIFSLAKSQKILFPIIALMLIIHTIAVIACFVLVDGSFS